jgi:hypothetical protein
VRKKGSPTPTLDGMQKILQKAIDGNLDQIIGREKKSTMLLQF